jgi:hypothetical protein
MTHPVELKNDFVFSELSVDQQMHINAGGFWGGVVTGLITVGSLAAAVAFAPAAGAAVGVVAGYYIGTALITVGGIVATGVAFSS